VVHILLKILSGNNRSYFPLLLSLHTCKIGFMRKTLSLNVETLHNETPQEKVLDHEEALSMVEELRLEAGKFLYEYPTRFRRVIEVIKKA